MVASAHTLTGAQTRNLRKCPDRESNLQNPVHGTMLPPAEIPGQGGQSVFDTKFSFSFPFLSLSFLSFCAPLPLPSPPLPSTRGPEVSLTVLSLALSHGRAVPGPQCHLLQASLSSPRASNYFPIQVPNSLISMISWRYIFF